MSNKNKCKYCDKYFQNTEEMNKHIKDNCLDNYLIKYKVLNLKDENVELKNKLLKLKNKVIQIQSILNNLDLTLSDSDSE